MGSAKGMEKVALWSDHIVRHFWHCCSLASEVEGNDLEALKILKVIPILFIIFFKVINNRAVGKR